MGDQNILLTPKFGNEMDTQVKDYNQYVRTIQIQKIFGSDVSRSIICTLVIGAWIFVWFLKRVLNNCQKTMNLFLGVIQTLFCVIHNFVSLVTKLFSCSSRHSNFYFRRNPLFSKNSLIWDGIHRVVFLSKNHFIVPADHFIILAHLDCVFWIVSIMWSLGIWSYIHLYIVKSWDVTLRKWVGVLLILWCLLEKVSKSLDKNLASNS